MQSVTLAGERKEGAVDLRRVVLDGGPEIEREELISKHEFGNR